MPQATPVLEVIAHRGLRDRYPENTVPAFRAAVDEGVDAIELDVHGTRDGVIVVHHDHLLPRDSPSPLAGRAICAIDAAELAGFELVPGICLPTLEEVLQAIAPPVRLYIEIKAANVEETIAALLAGLPTGAERCAVHSFDHRIVRRFGSLAPAIPTGVLQVGYPVNTASVLAAANARDLWQACEFVDQQLVSNIHSAGGRVIAWTCDDPDEWERLLELGVDGICTDRSAALASWLRERNIR